MENRAFAQRAPFLKQDISKASLCSKGLILQDICYPDVDVSVFLNVSVL